MALRNSSQPMTVDEARRVAAQACIKFQATLTDCAPFLGPSNGELANILASIVGIARQRIDPNLEKPKANSEDQSSFDFPTPVTEHFG